MVKTHRIIAIIAAVGILAVAGCGGDEDEDGLASGSSMETDLELNEQDVVMTAEEAEALAAPAAEAPADAPPGAPGAPMPPEPDTDKAEAEAVAKMTAREKAEYEERVRPIKEAAEIESANNSILLGDLQQAVESYHFDNGKLPANLGVLVTEGYLDRIPRIPAGKKVRINGATMEVTLE